MYLLYMEDAYLTFTFTHLTRINTAAFVSLLLIAASLGLAPDRLPQYKQSDKVLHFLTFLLITLCFYWILETTRRRLIHLTLLICTAGLSIGSEVVQGLLPVCDIETVH